MHNLSGHHWPDSTGCRQLDVPAPAGIDWIELTLQATVSLCSKTCSKRPSAGGVRRVSMQRTSLAKVCTLAFLMTLATLPGGSPVGSPSVMTMTCRKRLNLKTVHSKNLLTKPSSQKVQPQLTGGCTAGQHPHRQEQLAVDKAIAHLDKGLWRPAVVGCTGVDRPRSPESHTPTLAGPQAFRA